MERRFVRWLAALYPPVCALCGDAGADGLDLCAGCRADLPRLQRGCPGCGRPLPERAAGGLCGRCLRRRPAYATVYAPYRYAPPVDRLIAEFKFRGRLANARLLGELLVRAARADGRAPPPVLIPVPLHPRRLRGRGYNQSVELARPLARAFGSRLEVDCVRRLRATAPQMSLPAKRRRANVRGVFAMRGGCRLSGAVAVVDDVMTTGATVDELARVLLRAGAASVEVWSIARAGQARSR
ncbi:competence protein F [Acidihalobacter prosperus]|uniref:Competence protein F n=2 Tax=Acidihalobacter prosperus TaxID=160660 RepID=A0A1A6C144_9GAMM|nr:competence protein F [Acidihalobacter prosperus]